jgi:hypothetical protein
MIHGENKAASYGVRFDGAGYKVEEEFRQCCHCQAVWVYRPGSGLRRGYCFKHDGWLCGQQACIDEQTRMVAEYEAVTGKVMSCLAFEELNDFKANQAARQAGIYGIDFDMTPAGLIIPKEYSV